MRVHHVGYAVKCIDKALDAFRYLGYEPISALVKDQERKIQILFMTNEYETIELIAPDGENNAVESVIKKNGPTPYHICYEVSNLNEAVKTLRERGYILIRKPQNAPALDNKAVAFLLHKDVGVIELLETQEA